MFRVKIKRFDETSYSLDFDTLGDACVYFFRHIGDTTHRIELYEAIANIAQEEPVFRIILRADRVHSNDPFRLHRSINIF